MLKDIVAHVPLGDSNPAIVKFAVSVAEAFGAHLEGVAFEYQPVVTAMAYGAVPADVIAWQQEESRKLVTAAIDEFTAAAARSGISFGTQSVSAMPGAAGDAFGSIARRYDMAIVGQPESSNADYDSSVLQSSLFESGRPVIAVPYIQRSPFKADRIVVCWDGSRAAARAIGDSLPILKRAKTVKIIMVTSERAKSDDVPGADMGQHLARHGVQVELQTLTAVDIDVFNAILSYVADNGIDLVVMGGYGHSRLREFVLGGVTRGIIADMTVPVLMAH